MLLPQLKTRVRNDHFVTTGLDRGRGRVTEAIWYLIKCVFFLSPLPWPSRLKIEILRFFGSELDSGVVIKPRVNIHLPWKLKVGEFTWLGEEVFILNLERVEIGSHCCISQRAFLCTGNHCYDDPAMAYRNRPIVIEDGVWIGAQSFVAPGVRIKTDAVITAGSVVLKEMPEQTICSGNPCEPRKPRWKSEVFSA